MVKSVGALNFSMAQQYVDRMVTVPEAAIADAIYTLLDRVNLLVEGAGAAALAALQALGPELAGRKVALVLTGGNMDARVLGRVLAERHG